VVIRHGLTFALLNKAPSARIQLLAPNSQARSLRLHYWILGFVLLYELFLFGFFVRWAWCRRTPEQPLTLAGETLVVNGDGYGYYAWLRSLLLDRDWNFGNEFDEHNPRGEYVPDTTTAIGKRANHYPVGPALLWAPAAITTHLLRTNVPGPWSAWPANGYSLPYQIAVGLTSMIVSLATLILLFGICRFYADQESSALAVAFLVFGTTLLNYQAIEVAMSHSSATFATALLVWYWLKTYGSRSWLRWAGLGALVGLTALMRYQLALFAVLPAGEFLFATFRRGEPVSWRSIGGGSGKLALAGLCSTIVFIPQMIAWKVVYGHYLVAPLALAHCWLQPDLSRILLSTDRGFFYWTPLTFLLVVAQFWFLMRKHPADSESIAGSRQPVALLLAALALQVYLLASVTGDVVCLGSAFGYRQLTECTVMLAPPMAVLLQRGFSGHRAFWMTLCLALCAWNMNLLALYHFEILPRQGGADLSTLVAKAWRLPGAWPAGFILFLSGPAMLGMYLFNRRQELIEPIAQPMRKRLRLAASIPLAFLSRLRIRQG